MVFAAPIFLLVFLPLVVASTLVVPASRRNTVLLAASLVFYLWGTGAFILLLVASVIGNDLAIRRLAAACPAARRRWVAVAVTGNLALLGYFKYAGFGYETALGMVGRPLNSLPAWADVALPVGISFFTFQAISAVVDLARDDAPLLQRRRDFALFVSFFPQLVAGPIVRYGKFAPQLVRHPMSADLAFRGLARFALGLAKKVVVADSVAVLADTVFGNDVLTTGDAWIGALAYSVQIYFDFSGYSDMAIGLGALFGFRLPENFARPYSSRTMTEFWRRWHITLSSWFRDYLYVPLGGSRRGAARTYRNLVIVFLATGLWHGAAWTFVAWGAYHGVWLVTERLLGARSSNSPLRWLGTFLGVVLGWVLFRSATFAGAIDHAGRMLTWHGGPSARVLYELGGRPGAALVVGLCATFLPRHLVLGERLLDAPGRLGDQARLVAVVLGLPVALVAALGLNFSAFLYFRF